ncbi:hypothetical protein LguiB_016435 [Lonicera macranthoides]
MSNIAQKSIFLFYKCLQMFGFGLACFGLIALKFKLKRDAVDFLKPLIGQTCLEDFS